LLFIAVEKRTLHAPRSAMASPAVAGAVQQLVES